MFRCSAALVAALFISCAAQRHERARELDPTSPSAPVPAASRAEDPLAPSQLLPDDDEKKKDDDPHAHHHHHLEGAPR